jgi:tight adherence protein B
MGVVLGLLGGLGLALILNAVTRRPAAAPGPGPHAGPSGSPLGHWWRRRAGALQDAGVTAVGPGRLFLAQLAVGLLTALLILLATASVSIAACFAVFGFVTPVALVRRLRDRRRAERREVWPDVVDNLASAVRAGLSLPEAVGAIADRGPEPLRPAFARFAADYRATGRFAESLDRLADELADPVADRLCEVLRLAREVGGTDLGRLLRTFSGFLREDARTRGELETRQGWTVNAARLAVAGPWLVLLLLATQSTTLTAFDSAGGRVLLVVGAVVCAVAYRLMVRIGRLPTEQRVLR